MQEVLEAIERHLGRSVSVSQLDYYQVIGLEVHCDDSQRIREALQEATNLWMQSETGKYPQSAQIIAKLLKQAQTILLDPDKRERYDLQLKKLRSTQTNASKSTQSSSEAESDRDQETKDEFHLFPNGDPMAPFSFESYGPQSSSRGAQCALLERIRDPHARLLELEQLFPSLSEFEYESQREDNNVNAYAVSTPPMRDPVSGGISLAQQLARKRKRKRIIASLLFFFGSQAILGVAIWAYLQEQNRSTSKNKALAKGRIEIGDASLPKLPSIPNTSKSENGIFPESKQDTPGNPAQTPSIPEKTTEIPPPDKTPLPESGMITGDKPTPEPIPKPQDGSMPNSVTAPDKPTMKMPTTTNESDSTPAESAEWRKLMVKARDALNRTDFETFEKEIARGMETATTPIGREQADRLDQLGQLYKIGTESFEEAKKKLSAASSIRVGATEVSIVESSAEKLVVRVSGKNQSHPWDKLPFGIAIALLDLTLDPQASTDVAARAVFFSLAPQFRETATKNELLKKRIDAWFEKAVGKAPIRNDLRQALTDSFE